MRYPSFVSSFSWCVSDRTRLEAAEREIVASLDGDAGVFIADSLIAWARNLGFVDDKPLISAWQAHAEEPHERGILWRTATLVWAARQALRVEGDFIECGCYRGTTARILLDAVKLDRPFYLYDLFEAAPRAMPAHGADLEGFVRERFAEHPNVVITKGRVPETLANAPPRIAFLHIDMNHAEAEIGALEALLPRMVRGGVIVLDDYGQLPYRAQHLAEREWFATHELPILEIPTGQGIVIT